MSMIDETNIEDENEIDVLMRITGMSKLDIKILSYLGKTTEEIIEISKNLA